jgi:chromosome segregation ATPase
MNDATELEPSLAGAIDFFQNLHRKMGVLETDTHARHDQLHSLSTTLVTLEQDRQSDRQTLITLASDLSAQDTRLAKLQTDSQALDKQLSTVETLVARFQEEQQEVRQALAALTGDLRTQGADLRKEMESALTQQAAPIEQVSALEARLASQTREQLGLLGSFHALEKGPSTLQNQMTTLESRVEQHQEQFGQLEKTDRDHQKQLQEFASIVESQHKRLLQLEITLENLDQSTLSTTQLLTVLKTDLKRHDQALVNLDQAAEASETARQQLQDQQTRLDELTESSTISRQDIALLKANFENQRRGLVDATQARHDFQKQQDRVKHLETLVGKVSADTNSTRQILNVLQTDLTTQSDTLRELDQSWRDSLTLYHDRLRQLETTVSASAEQTTAREETHDKASASSALGREQFASLEKALAETRKHYETLQQELHTVQRTLGHQDDNLTELRDHLNEQLETVRQQIAEFESTLDHLRQKPEPTPGAETESALNTLRQDLTTQAEALDEIQQLAWSQIQDLQQRLSEAEATLDDLGQTPEAPSTLDIETPFDHLRQDLLAQTGALGKLQDTTQQQFADLRNALETRQQEFLEIAGQLSHLQQEIQNIQSPEQQPASDSTLVEQRLETVEIYSRKLQEDLENLQETVTALETRLSSQSQAYSGNFEQFRTLNSEIHALQQKVVRLETPQLGNINQELVAHQQDIVQLREVVEQIQADSQQMGEMIQQGGAESPVAEITARLDEQQERLNELATTVETVRADAKSAQETVVTMATNVAKRIHEIQNLLVATETTQGERLQEVEQKLIWLQAALETMENQKTKPRRWFSMPASLTSILLTVGGASVALLAELAWIIN